MPKSKRERLVSLTQTVKRTAQSKSGLLERVRECCEMYTHCYVISFTNMRNKDIKDVRDHWKSSTMFFGKNKVMQIALGRKPQDEHKDGLHKVSKFLNGQRALFFTNSAKDEVVKYFEKLNKVDFARSGFVATETFEIPAGPIEHMEFSMEPRLKELGLPVRLNDRKLELLGDFVVCKKDQELSPEQCKILELFSVRMAVFTGRVHCVWTDGKFESLLSDD
eukprot:334300_1